MGKQKSDLVSDMMRGAQIVKAISDALRDQGGDDSYLKKILGEHSPFPGRIADLLMEQEKKHSRNPRPSDSIAAEYGYTVVDGKDVEPSQFQIKDLEFVPFLEPGESWVNGKVMCERAITLKANLGLVDAKRLLDNQSEIPPEFRNYALIFTGTLLRGSGGGLHVACLYSGGDHWYLRFFWLDDVWNGNDRLLRCKS